MECIKYSEEELFTFAMQNTLNLDLIKILVKDFGLNVNWRHERFYDTLLYQALKGSDISVAEYLISQGACVNASLGGYPKKPSDHGDYSILDVAAGFNSLEKVGGAKWLVNHGAISFEKLPIPNNKKKEIIQKIDETTPARNDKYITITRAQAKLSVMEAPDDVYKKLQEFVDSCKLVDINVSPKVNR